MLIIPFKRVGKKRHQQTSAYHQSQKDARQQLDFQRIRRLQIGIVGRVHPRTKFRSTQFGDVFAHNLLNHRQRRLIGIAYVRCTNGTGQNLK